MGRGGVEFGVGGLDLGRMDLVELGALGLVAVGAVVWVLGGWAFVSQGSCDAGYPSVFEVFGRPWSSDFDFASWVLFSGQREGKHWIWIG